MQGAPFPNQELLDRRDVMHLLGLSPSAWKRFQNSETGKRFPKARILCESAKGHVLRWRKNEVLAFCELLRTE